MVNNSGAQLTASVILILTGQVLQIPEGPPQATVFYLVILLCRGRLRSKVWCLGLQPRQSTNQWQAHAMRSHS